MKLALKASRLPTSLSNHNRDPPPYQSYTNYHVMSWHPPTSVTWVRFIEWDIFVSSNIAISRFFMVALASKVLKESLHQKLCI